MFEPPNPVRWGVKSVAIKKNIIILQIVKPDIPYRTTSVAKKLTPKTNLITSLSA